MVKRKLTHARREYLKWRKTEQRREIKRKAVEYKGGCCSICSYNKSIAGLIFHHLDPSKKTFAIAASGISHSWKSVKKEIEKCILICANCHAEIHEQENKKNAEEKLIEIRKLVPERSKEHGSIIKNCFNCNKEIKVFNSIIVERNFCSRACRDKVMYNTYPDNFLELAEKYSVKELSKILNKSKNVIYRKLSQIKKVNMIHKSWQLKYEDFMNLIYEDFDGKNRKIYKNSLVINELDNRKIYKNHSKIDALEMINSLLKWLETQKFFLDEKIKNFKQYVEAHYFKQLNDLLTDLNDSSS